MNGLGHEFTNLGNIISDIPEISGLFRPIPIDQIHENPAIFVARFDQMHPVVSGNKWFKLLHFLSMMKEQKKDTVITQGGAYSNHLLATAFLGAQLGIQTIGLVRGNYTNTSVTLHDCISWGMQIIPVSNKQYRAFTDWEACLPPSIGTEKAVFIPEGGFDPIGADGAGSMASFFMHLHPTHIGVPVGTATTLAGLLKHTSHVTLIGFPVLKGLNDVQKRIETLIGPFDQNRLTLYNDYHFGGYARSHPSLLEYMNTLYTTKMIPTDFVYTAKMFYGVFDLLKHDLLDKNARIVLVHTGGLQGNRTLTPGSLVFS
jgi:1-aminocyclopropane-1-carboxylate deaminase